MFLFTKISTPTFWSGWGIKLTTYLYLAPRLRVEKYLFMAPQPYSGPGRLIVEVSRAHAVSRTTVGRTPLDEVSSLRRDIYLTTPDIHKRQASVSLTGFEPAIPASERPQTHALDHTTIPNSPTPSPHISSWRKQGQLYLISASEVTL
jgi:hypothetical protein